MQIARLRICTLTQNRHSFGASIVNYQIIGAYNAPPTSVRIIITSPRCNNAVFSKLLRSTSKKGGGVTYISFHAARKIAAPCVSPLNWIKCPRNSRFEAISKENWQRNITRRKTDVIVRNKVLLNSQKWFLRNIAQNCFGDAHREERFSQVQIYLTVSN